MLKSNNKRQVPERPGVVVLVPPRVDDPNPTIEVWREENIKERELIKHLSDAERSHEQMAMQIEE